ncbi:NADH dehydrogenase, FAD-containing subunit [Pseudomonas fluorescens]|uniref:NADH dehydrogenase, FAD-containing subunit n=1 Tax=Pseudomonas fluorescens TaxID=294 RepID=A0A448DVH1_PSEFL|nr:NADH dehydrogenase, FAD-containing subunit [Pseudomonas fluorescens]
MDIHHALIACGDDDEAVPHIAVEISAIDPPPYIQPRYVTCLDLGGWGAVYTEGQDCQVKSTRQEGKSLKTQINTVWVYAQSANMSRFGQQRIH